MKEKKSPATVPFIISFILIDLMILGIFLALNNYASLGDGFFASMISMSWLFLLVIAVISLILSIILINDYLDLRTALAEELILFVFGLWFGIARVPLMNDSGKGNFILFIAGSILLLVVNIALQVDLLCAPKIKNFLTTDKQDRERKQKTNVSSKANPLFPADSPVYQTRTTQVEREQSTHDVKLDKPENRHYADYETKNVNIPSTTLKSTPQSVRPSQRPMTEEQLIQFREYQAKRRAARAAAAQQLKNSGIQFDMTPPTGRTARRNYAEQTSSTSQAEALFFKDEQ